MNEIIQLSATQIARAIKDRKWTPSEVVEAFINRIEEVNSKLNAVVTPMFETARETARQYTEQIKSANPNDLPPLFGVPVTIKDAIAVKGVRFTAGSVFMKDYIAEEDAETVRRLKEAGAILLGKTNLPTMSSAVETVNNVFGRTRNPWNLRRSPGGSSGGEAAIIASAGSPLGMGADIAGSLRLPAAFCGITSLKPTGGRISTHGHVPEAPNPIGDFNVIGPMAKKVEDLYLALSILSNTPVKNYKEINVTGRRVVLPGPLPLAMVVGAVKRGWDAAAQVLTNNGMDVQKRPDLPMMSVLFGYMGLMDKYWKVPAGKLISNTTEGRPKLALEFFKSIFKLSPVTATELYIPAFIDMSSFYFKKYSNFDKLEEFRQIILDAMGEGGVMLWPVFPFPAPRHGYAFSLVGSPVYTMIINALGFPSAVVPVGFSWGRLPLSVQVIGRLDEDETVLAVAEILEQHFGGWKMPPI